MRPTWLFSERRQHVLAWSCFAAIAFLTLLLGGCGHADQLRRSAHVAERAVAVADVIVTEHVRAYADAMNAQVTACMSAPQQDAAARDACMAAFQHGDEVAALVEKIVQGLELSDELVAALLRLADLMDEYERSKGSAP